MELSPQDIAILQELEKAFADVPRPEHFTNYTHCEECAEHDDVLRSRTPQTLQREDLGNVGWDPITFATPQGFAYYFPALARVALEASSNGRDDWYAAMLIGQLLPRQTHSERRGYLSANQRRAVASFLAHLISTREEELKYQLEFEDAERALNAWDEKHAA